MTENPPQTDKNYSITEATEQHVYDMLDRVRDVDRKEVEAFGVSLKDGLLASVRQAHWARAGVTEDGIACIWGVRTRSILSGVGVPWLIGTDVMLMPKYRRSFLRESRLQLADIRREFPKLGNYVSAENTIAQHWLQWLGFSFHEPKTINDVRFVPFSLRG